MQKNTNTMQYFYQNGQLVTLTGKQSRSIFRSPDMPLAEYQTQGSSLLVTDDKGSVLQVQEKD
ncbi:hypothetical protein [Pseudomonas sp. NPDC008258]|uniref:hypothetical protein n=1 Tax=Pseudomonas sp. NPDC008258 TaxID=3364418 RepID=UPI0036E1FED3